MAGSIGWLRQPEPTLWPFFAYGRFMFKFLFNPLSDLIEKASLT